MLLLAQGVEAGVGSVEGGGAIGAFEAGTFGGEGGGFCGELAGLLAQGAMFGAQAGDVGQPGEGGGGLLLCRGKGSDCVSGGVPLGFEGSGFVGGEQGDAGGFGLQGVQGVARGFVVFVGADGELAVDGGTGDLFE